MTAHNPIVLVAEDDNSIAQLIQLSLPKEVICRRVENGRECLESVRREKPDLIIMDVMMPEMDGFTAATELASDEATRDIPIIVLTAKSGMKDAFLSPNIVDFVSKPFDVADFRARILKRLSL